MAGIERLGLHGVTGRLAANRFTLVGDDQLGRVLSSMQGDELEEQLCAILWRGRSAMPPPAVDVMDSGAVMLGTNVVCDGYAYRREFRVQTHIHDDHMDEFDKSKGCQDILLSPETLALLIEEHERRSPVSRESVPPPPRGRVRTKRRFGS